VDTRGGGRHRRPEGAHMTLWTDPIIWGLAVLAGLAVVVFVWPPLAEMSGLRPDEDRDELAPWAVVLGGWVGIVLAIWALVGLWRGLGRLVGQ